MHLTWQLVSTVDQRIIIQIANRCKTIAESDLDIELMFITSSLLSLLNAHYDRAESELGDFISTPDFRSSRALKSQTLKDFNFNQSKNDPEFHENHDYLAQ